MHPYTCLTLWIRPLILNRLGFTDLPLSYSVLGYELLARGSVRNCYVRRHGGTCVERRLEARLRVL